MKFIIKFIFYAVCLAILSWFLISWADVLMNNNPCNIGNVKEWNAFQIIAELGEVNNH